jgi:hypothetical protein
MPCCGGNNGGKPITRTQYWLGRVFFACIRIGLRVGLATVGRVSPRFREIARFWDLLSADWARSIAVREGIAFVGEDTVECPLPPPSHVAATAGAIEFGSDWPDDETLFDDAELGPSRDTAAQT